ncbi:MAG: FMN-binding protein [Treponema sp.]|jgi:major membrane immunogen (membrane-anchored lipoprotein)|nr:FMN-binding protein [Treponema sp.]
MKNYKIIFFAALLLAGCGKAVYKDGVYTGVSSADDTGAYGEVSINIADSKITDCSFITRQKDGAIKDENYGKVNGEISNQDYYAKAQLAVKAMEDYVRQYRETWDINKIDAVSGATIAYNQFVEAVEKALAQAK